jgi:hypothetical protein
MAASDSAVPFSQIDGTLTASDGASASLEFDFVQSDIEWTVEGAPYTEAKVRNKHKATPVLRKTGDGNVTGSASLLVTSLRGSTDETPYEFLTQTGGSASITTRAAGDRKAIKLAFTVNASAAGGASQLVEFNYSVCQNVKVSPSGSDGLFLLTFDFTDHESAPTVT